MDTTNAPAPSLPPTAADILYAVTRARAAHAAFLTSWNELETILEPVYGPEAVAYRAFLTGVDGAGSGVVRVLADIERDVREAVADNEADAAVAMIEAGIAEPDGRGGVELIR